MKRNLKKTSGRKRQGQSESDVREVKRNASRVRKLLADLERIEKESKESSREAEKRLTAFARPAWPPELILKARELSKAGKFKRRIVKRTPVSMHTDSAELECGHTAQTVFSWDDRDMRDCVECENNWLKRHAKKPKR
jgi:hypothetical protein